MKKLLAIFFIFSVSLQADIALSSPKVSINEQGQFLIQFTINSDSNIKSKDIALNEYQSDIALPEELLAFTLFEEEGRFDKFTIALGNNYPEDYFSFQLVINDELTKNVFIFLPTRYKNFSQQPDYSAPKAPVINKPAIAEPKELIEESVQESLELLEDTYTDTDTFIETPPAEVVIDSSEITTMWSLASKIAAETDADIYQIMWAIFLANEKAFIDNNINRVRGDIDLTIPSNAVLSNISSKVAKASIQQMNSTPQRLGVSKNIKSLLTLSAPKDDLEEILTPAPSVEEAIEDRPINLSSNLNQDDLNPVDFIETNTKTIELGVNNEPLEALQQGSENADSPSSIGLLDLVLVGLAALLVGFVLAFIYIQMNSRKVKEKVMYDFDNPAEEGGIQGLPSGLSVKNDADTQQLDLALTYIEMDNFDNAKEILNALIKSTDNDSVKAEAAELLLRTL